MPLVKKIKDASRLGRPLEVRYATRSIKKFLRAEKYREAVAKLHGQKRWKQRIRKMLGLPARGHLGHYGSKETKKYYSGIRARMAGFRKLRFPSMFMEPRGCGVRVGSIPKLRKVRSRLYRSPFLQPRARFAVFFKIDNIDKLVCTAWR